jgi:hypothetical protein
MKKKPNSNQSASTKTSSDAGASNPATSKDPKDKPEEYVSEESFIENLIKIFVGDIDSKMKFTFDM